MVNADVVNGERWCTFMAVLGEIFRVLGRILGPPNPVKYTRNFNINQPTVHFSRVQAKTPEI